ncbi:hypothetical protein HMPREF1980_01013 [Actinomyces sp. oral taxon 172 str. F0311]|nr:hypothetical protein HMPREF1980_01013 [Actinomyces sp. oral taxon 172 str. F0311]
MTRPTDGTTRSCLLDRAPGNGWGRHHSTQARRHRKEKEPGPDGGFAPLGALLRRVAGVSHL